MEKTFISIWPSLFNDRMVMLSNLPFFNKKKGYTKEDIVKVKKLKVLQSVLLADGCLVVRTN